MKIKINITKEVLERSKYCGTKRGIDSFVEKHNIKWKDLKYYPTPTNCAIAFAIRDVFPNSSTTQSVIFIFDKPEIINKEGKSSYDDDDFIEYILLPSKAIEFIEKFDKYKPSQRVNMKPFSFEIIVPDNIINSIGINEINALLKESKYLETV